MKNRVIVKVICGRVVWKCRPKSNRNMPTYQDQTQTYNVSNLPIGQVRNGWLGKALPDSTNEILNEMHYVTSSHESAETLNKSASPSKEAATELSTVENILNILPNVSKIKQLLSMIDTNKTSESEKLKKKLEKLSEIFSEDKESNEPIKSRRDPGKKIKRGKKKSKATIKKAENKDGPKPKTETASHSNEDPYEFKEDSDSNTKNSDDGFSSSDSEDESLASSASLASSETVAELKKKIKRKRGRGGWQSVVIKPIKKKKKVYTKTDDTTLDEKLKEPRKDVTIPDMDSFTDKKYSFLKNVTVYPCRLCEYSGDDIVHHYKTRHPHSEVLLSRLDPETARDAIKESEGVNFQAVSNIATDKYVCRFCYREFVSKMKDTLLETFFWHVVSIHTGEYKQLCSECINLTRCPFNLDIPPPPKNVHGQLVGYICEKCNFTQLSLENLKNHVNVRHNDEQTSVFMINLAVMGKKMSQNAMVHIEPGVHRSLRVTEKQSDERSDANESKGVKETSEMEMTNAKSVTESPTLKPVPDVSKMRANLTFEEVDNISDVSNIANPEGSIKEADSDDVDHDHVATENISYDRPAEFLDHVKNQETDFQHSLNTKNISRSNGATDEVVDLPLYKVSYTGAKEYVCYSYTGAKDNGTMIHYKTTLLTSMKEHIQTQHKENWDCYCSICRVIVMPQEAHTFKGYVKHLTDNHFDNFPSLETKESAHTKQTTLPVTLLPETVEKPPTPNPYINVPPLSELILKDKIPETEESLALPVKEAEKAIELEKVIDSMSAFTISSSSIVHKSISISSEAVGTGDPIQADNVQQLLLESQRTVTPPPMICNDLSIQNTPVLKTEPMEEQAQPVISEVINLDSDEENFRETDERPPIPNPFINVRPLSEPILRDITPEPEESPALPVIERVVCLSAASVDATQVTSTETDNVTPPRQSTPSPPRQPTPTRPPSVPPLAPVLQPVDYEKPQADVIAKKQQVVLDTMMSRDTLVHIFKCAGRYCCFSTDSAEHALLHASAHQRLGGENSLICAYCDFDCSGNYIDLVTHVFKVHGRCQFACSQCFYRAVASQLVSAHMLRVHGEAATQGVVLKTATVTPGTDAPTDQLTREVAVAYYTCVNAPATCKYRTYIQNKFGEHLAKHEPPFMCNICAAGFPIATALLEHLKCHEIMLYQCTWCVFGADDEASLLAHASARHPTKVPQAYLRVVTTRETPDGTLKMMVLPLVQFNSSVVQTELVTPTNNKNSPVKEAERAIDLENLIASMSAFSTCSVAPKSESVSSYGCGTDDPMQADNVQQLLLESPRTVTPPPTICNDLSIQNISVLKTEPIKEQEQPILEVIDLDSEAEEEDSKDAGSSYIDISDDNSRCSAVQKSQAQVVKSDVLFKCSRQNCTDSSKKKDRLSKHLISNSGSMKCALCPTRFDTVSAIMRHCEEEHGRNNECGTCGVRDASLDKIKRHFRREHGSKDLIVASTHGNDARILYVVKESPTQLQNTTPQKDGPSVQRLDPGPKRKLSAENLAESPAKKKRYSPQDVDQLPSKPILDELVYCALCEFNTKERLKLVRHLQWHAEKRLVVQLVAIKPVLHSETSSIVRAPDEPEPSVNLLIAPEAASRYPKYVPERERLTCGARGCSYTSVDEEMLKLHWETLHAGTNDYHCVHCPPYQHVDTSKPLTASQILSHLKMHGVCLYTCASCAYYHYKRQALEKHLNEAHQGVGQVMVVREDGTVPPTASQPPPFSGPTMDQNPCQSLPETSVAPVLLSHLAPTVHLEIVKEKPDENTEMSIEDLRKKYGEFCEPNGLKYKCPLCKIVDDDSKESMQSHLFEELQYRKWGCSMCTYKAFHKTGLNEHMLTEHRQHRDPTELPLNQHVETWVAQLLQHQTDLIQKAKENFAKQKIQVAKPRIAPSTSRVQERGVTKRVPRKSTKKRRTQSVAKKSTTKLPFLYIETDSESEEYSYYGNKPQVLGDYPNVTTLLPFCNKLTTFSVKQLSEIIKLDPKVIVEDINKLN